MADRKVNFLKSVDKAFGDIEAGFTTLIDLKKTYFFEHLLLQNNTDADVTIKFTNSADIVEVIVLAGNAIGMDQFFHWDIVQIKRTSGAPTTGVFKLISW